MNNLLKKANAKKLKFNKKNKVMENEDSDGEISIDNVETLEEDTLGTILNENYLVCKYLNKGTFSRVWLLHHLKDSEFYAGKFFNSESIEEYKNELSILKQYTTYDNNSKNNLNYIDHFECELNGNKVYVIVTQLYGKALNQILDEIENDDYHVAFKNCILILKSMCQSVAKLHELNILHTDLKFDNVLTDSYDRDIIRLINKIISLELNSVLEEYYDKSLEEYKVNDMNKNQRKKYKRKLKAKSHKYLKDFYSKEYFELNKETLEHSNIVEDDNEKHKDIKIINIPEALKFVLCDYSNSLLEKEVNNESEYQIRAYRSAENLLSITYTKRSESWSLGCILWDLLMNELIFEPNLKQNKLERDREQLSLMEKYLGKISKDITMDCPRTFELYDDNGKILKNKKVEREELEDKLKKLRTDLTEEHIALICDFLRECWNYDYLKRKTPEELLKHKLLNLF